MIKYIFNFLIFVLLVTSLNAKDSFFVKNIVLDGVLKSSDIDPIISKHRFKNRTLQEINLIANELEDYYKSIGYTLVEVTIPKQDIKDGILHLKLNIAKVGDISVEGEKHYTKEFIQNGIVQKSGDLLNYQNLIKSLLLLNDYRDLKVSSFLRKSSLVDSTDIVLKVEDEKPLHVDVWYDNLGSEDTSKNRLGVDFFYGNLFRDGDEVTINPVLSFAPSKTKFVSTNYSIPINNLQTKLRFGFLYADYLAGGDFTDLSSEGDTLIYSTGIVHPLIRSITNRVDFSFNLTKKLAKNYLLDQISSDEDITFFDTSVLWQNYSIYSTSSLYFSIAKGELSGNSIKSRVDEDSDFFKTNIQFFYNRTMNEKTNLLYTLNGQYSSSKLPPTEMFSIGGLTTVRGFKSGFKLGDSGFFTSLAGYYMFNLAEKKSLKIGAFCDYGKVYVNEPVPGEDRESFLIGAGVEGILNINDKYSSRLSLGYPLDSSDDLYKKKLNLYLTISAKLW